MNEPAAGQADGESTYFRVQATKLFPYRINQLSSTPFNLNNWNVGSSYKLYPLLAHFLKVTSFSFTLVSLLNSSFYHNASIKPTKSISLKGKMI